MSRGRGISVLRQWICWTKRGELPQAREAAVPAVALEQAASASIS